MLVEILVFLAQREAEHDLAGPRQLALADQRLHLRDVIAIRGLDAQVGAQVVGEAVVAVERDRGIAMRFGGIQHPGHPLGRGEIEQILRHVGAGGDRAPEQVHRPLMQPEQAEDGAERIERLGRVADDVRSRFGGHERRAGLAGDEQAFGPQNVRDRILGRQRDRPIGADDGGIRAAPLQRGLGQQRPGAAIVRRGGQHLRADPFGRREVAASEARVAPPPSRCVLARCGAVRWQAAAP